MKITQRKSFAWLITAIMIFIAIFYFGGNKLNNRAEKVTEIFFVDEQNDGLSIDHALSARCDEAYNLYTIAKRYLDSNDPLLDNLLKAREDLLNTDSISKKKDANTLLTAAVQDVYDALADYELNAADARYREDIRQQLESYNATISHDDYNSQAQKFNKLRSTFPANLIASVRGIEYLELFR